ncbi:MAG: putative capsid protein [Cressdnaviricota sp.]|nr:MAG: putative capsid protein [Cressdnaviricota sp.]
MGYKRRSYGYGGGSRRTRRRRSSGIRPLAIKCAKSIAEKKSTKFDTIRENDTNSLPENHTKVYNPDNSEVNQFAYNIGLWKMYNGAANTLPRGFDGSGTDTTPFIAADGMKFPQLIADGSFTDDQYNRRVGREIFYRKSYRRLTIQMNMQNNVILQSRRPGGQLPSDFINTQWDGIPTQFRVFHFYVKNRFTCIPPGSTEAWQYYPDRDFFISMGDHTEFGIHPGSLNQDAERLTPNMLHNAYVNTRKYGVIKEHRFTLDNPLYTSLGPTVARSGGTGDSFEYPLERNGAYHGYKTTHPTRKTIHLTDYWNKNGKFDDPEDVEPNNFNFQTFTMVVSYKLQGARTVLMKDDIPGTIEQNYIQTNVDFPDNPSGPVPPYTVGHNDGIPPSCNNYRVLLEGQTTAFDL